MAIATLYVCTTCRRGQPGDAETSCASCPLGVAGGGDRTACAACHLNAGGEWERVRPGAQLLAALNGADIPEGVVVRGVECLSACSNGCSVALSAPGKWTYVYGNLDPDQHAGAILEGAAHYAASADGIVPWRARPEIFRKQSLARIPPQEPQK